MLGITKLDEETQKKLINELETIIAAKAAEKAAELLVTEKEKLVSEMETKFDNYKEDITSKFSNFLDDILNEELVIPQNVLEFAKLGEEYKPLIESFKVKLAIDEGVLDNEVKSLLKEAKDEIIKLTEEKDKLTAVKLDYEVKNAKITNENYLLNKCEGLTVKQKSKVFAVLEGAGKEEIDKKFDILLKLNESTEEFETKECPECGIEVKEDATICPECEYEFGAKDKKDENGIKESNKKKVEKDTKKIDEANPRAAWIKMLNEKKI